MKKIKISERAHKEIKKLFSSRNSVNTLKSDPELTAIFDNFAFDDTLEVADGTVIEKTRIMCILASTIGCNALTEFRIHVDAALNVGVKPREIREIVYQAVPFLGFSRVIDFLLTMNEVFDNNDIRLPLDDQATTTEEDKHEKGRQMIDALWGEGNAENMKETSPKGQEHIVRFMEGYCFGQFYTRNGIDLQHRELITFCMLAALGGCDDRLRTHAIGCKNTHITKKEMVAAVTAMLPWIGFPRSLNALNIINDAYSERLI
ncbi:MAG: carboxymuconolactone decarboxylase family protein [Prevotellaceae bacterium]|nr:carboxymuconolactone decarboxylase family protein [Prevotellaceae bacterium]